MKAIHLLKGPLWAADILLGGKSFRKNPIIASNWLNERGFHTQRILLAQRLANLRRRQMTRFLSAQDRAFFEENGYIIKHNVLPEPIWKQVRQELEHKTFPAREMKQGRSVTRFIGLSPSVLKAVPGLRAAAHNPLFQKGLRYAASHNADPLLYLHTVLWDLEETQKDPQTNFHSDTFHATAKAWLFLKDVTPENGPFHYVPGSHKLCDKRINWEFQQSLTAATHKDGNHASGSFRITKEQMAELGYPEPVSFAVPANSMVIADTHGFHARGIATRPGFRIGLYGSIRRSPFAPWAGLDLRSLPLLKGRQMDIFAAYLDHKAKSGASVSHIDVGQQKAMAPAVR